ncbi:monovalent cation/H+ antiporter subunit D [Zestomonas thermotolerans]|uniref:monovalent cation/H+ antiporter subunit D n=1 Tax=Zestomonas thermotolerans TaxID=157784 RepID=UPI000381F9EF|nr:monovalent cation/H+ antiporter subunit D [Pseudomonas thermotolerans]MBO2510414.1 monovalent cation/H+ antiporter subunit D [Gammaproteobacteria bacterium]
MSGWQQHLIVLPILVPFVAAAALVPMDETRRRSKAAIGLLSVLLQLAGALYWVVAADRVDGAAPAAVYLLADWDAPVAISLALDRLTAVMLLLNALLACAALIFAVAKWDRVGVHFHVLFQLLLMGINGAFLTNDLFNLFVFFEVMLAASYGLLLHGSGRLRVKAGLHYIAINLVASSIFLIGVALMYSASGTLNMADMARKLAGLGDADRQLFETGAAVLAVAFLIKSAVWPLNFWLPGSYGAAVAPVSAIFAIMTKVGFYVLLRLWLLVFGDAAGASGSFGAPWLVGLGLATLTYAIFGMLAATNFKRFAGFSVIASAGTLLTAIPLGGSSGTAAALYYLLASTLAVAAFYLLVDLLERIRDYSASLLAVTIESFEAQGMILPEESEVGVAIPAAMAFLALAFGLCLLVLSGLPPLAGFVGKFALLVSALGSEAGQFMQYAVWLFVVLLVVAGFAATLTLTRLGIQLFWVPERHKKPLLRLAEAGPVAALIGLVVLLTLAAGPVLGYLQRAADALHAPAAYIDGVLGAQPKTSGEGRP